MAEMTAQAINDLPDSAFAYIEEGGSKDAQGKTVPRSKRHFPIHDAAHVRAALSRAPQSPFGDKAMPKIKAAARKFGIEVADDESRSEPAFLGPQMFVRSYPLEDIRILSRAQGTEYADGRTVEAYVAVFDRPTEIHDDQGHYMEEIDRTAFDRAIHNSRPQGGRDAWRTSVFYNHGMTLYGTPSDRFSVPLGKPLDIRTEERGLLTVTRYNRTPLADEILEAISSGDITGHSFTGRIYRSDPTPPRRGYQRSATGELTKVRRTELGLREYGPTPYPAYVDTAVVGMRSMLPMMAALLSTTQDHTDEPSPAEGAEMARTEGDDSVDSGTPSDEGLAPEDSPEGHSSRDSLLRRIAAAKSTRPGLTRDPADEARRVRAQAIVRPERSPE